MVQALWIGSLRCTASESRLGARVYGLPALISARNFGLLKGSSNFLYIFQIVTEYDGEC